MTGTTLAAWATGEPHTMKLPFDVRKFELVSATGEGAGHWGGAEDGVMRCPIRWDSLFLLDNVGGAKKSGTAYLGSLMVVYD